MIELVAFLGNPGPEYALSRHNTAWLMAQKLKFYKDLSWKKKFKGFWAVMESSRLPITDLPKTGLCFEPEENPKEAGRAEDLPPKIHFLEPLTYMNLSGDSVLAASSFFRIPAEKIIVVHDELELPLGFISLKFGGGLGGHNGLRSMKEKFGTADFWRLRIGIGRPGDRPPGRGGSEGSGRGVLDWVLSSFSAEEIPVLEPVLEGGASLLSGLLVSGPGVFLPEWKKKKIPAII